MDIRDIKNRKKQLGLTNKQLADYSGVSLGTVNKILSGATKSRKNGNRLAIRWTHWIVRFSGRNSGIIRNRNLFFAFGKSPLPTIQ